MATSICPDKAVRERSSFGGTESKQAVHRPQQERKQMLQEFSCQTSQQYTLFLRTYLDEIQLVLGVHFYLAGSNLAYLQFINIVTLETATNINYL